MWRKIREFDRIPYPGGRYMTFFIGESFYFIIALCGDYQNPIYMAELAAVMTMGLVFLYLSAFVVQEGENWVSFYEKIRYFPVDRKKYLLQKAAAGLALTGIQTVITLLVFLCRILIRQELPMETIVLILLCMAGSGAVYLIAALFLLAAGGRTLTLFPLPFLAGGGWVYVVCKLAAV